MIGPSTRGISTDDMWNSGYCPVDCIRSCRFCELYDNGVAITVTFTSTYDNHYNAVVKYELTPEEIKRAINYPRSIAGMKTKPVPILATKHIKQPSRPHARQGLGVRRTCMFDLRKMERVNENR